MHDKCIFDGYGHLLSPIFRVTKLNEKHSNVGGDVRIGVRSRLYSPLVQDPLSDACSRADFPGGQGILHDLRGLFVFVRAL